MSVPLLFLAVLVYLLGGFAALALNRVGKAAQYAAGLTAVAAAAIALAAAIPILVSGAVDVFETPGVLPFANFAVRFDGLAALMVSVIALLSAATGVYSLAYLDAYAGRNLGFLGFFTNLFLASTLLVVTVSNAVYFLVFWELMALASYCLVTFETEKEEAVRAGFLYLLIAHAGTALIMLAFLLYFYHGESFDFAAFRLTPLPQPSRDLAFLLAFFGFGAKAGLAPLHIWLPRAHPAAPSHISALLSGAMIKTAIYGILRICADCLGASAWWWGLTVLAFGAASAVLGVLFANAERDLKRLLAYCSVENIGVILMGTGVGMLGVATGRPVLAALGLLAALYHLVNHAAFKGLLFLSAGSVVFRLGTKDMDAMGGLARRMPWTALAFFVGAAAVSALPPLNGFVSEWFLYQSLFTASGGHLAAVRASAPIFAVVLALAGALAAACFVKAYGLTFAGVSRSPRARQAQEAPLPMLLGMGLLALTVLGLGLGAPWVAPVIGRVAAGLIGQAPPVMADGVWVFPVEGAPALLSTPLIAILLLGAVTLPALMAAVFSGARAGRRVDETAWACGYNYSPRMEITAGGFGRPLRAIFGQLYGLGARAARPGRATARAFQGLVALATRVEPAWNDRVYDPIARGVQGIGRRVQALQIGDIRLYCLYIVLTLAVLLLIATRW